MSTVETPSQGDHSRLMDQVYRHQRHIYDATRKYYLLGRDRTIAGLGITAGQSLLEIGCGTGRNLALVARHYPSARLFGLDISTEMLATARSKLSGLHEDVMLRELDASRFNASDFGESGFDRILISYALSMIPEWRQTIAAALAALAPGGSLHIVDFGQQEGLPRVSRRVLHAWLARFHVAPRADLESALRGVIEGAPYRLAFESHARGYAWLAVVRRL